MTIAWAGGGDFEARTQQIKKAYSNMQAQVPQKAEKPVTIATTEAKPKIIVRYGTEIKVDGIDNAYVWFRTFVPSWLMGIIFLAGLFTMIPVLLKKFFGIEINFKKLIVKTKTEKEAPDA